ncbi:MAG: hypothetical protein JST42_25625 [Bacteroidetes bacterium]|nr:hypothetical protein [Bacteroidota bacterium]
MDTQYAQMEVLLITGTTLLSRDLCGKDDTGKDKASSANEQLEKACWDGLLPSLLPEVFDQVIRDNHLYLWGVRATDAFLQLDLSEAPIPVESPSSINPYSFLSTQSYN